MIINNLPIFTDIKKENDYVFEVYYLDELAAVVMWDQITKEVAEWVTYYRRQNRDIERAITLGKIGLMAELCQGAK